MNYLRVYTGADGETHFEDVRVPTTARRSPVSDARVEASELFPTTGVRFRRVVTDHDPGTPHPAPRRQFVVHLAGRAELEVSDGDRRRIGPGDVVLVEDTAGKGHITRRLGTEDRVTLFLPLADGGPTAERMTGTWRLVSWQTHQDGGKIGHPFGTDAQGLLVYTADGRVSGQMMRANRRVFSRPRTEAVEFDVGDAGELAAAFNSFLAYAGRWTVGEDGLVRHHVEIASIPGWAGTVLRRKATFDDGRLVLRTPPRIIDGVGQRGVLVWEPA